MDRGVFWLLSSNDPYGMPESDAEGLVLAPWEIWAEEYRYEGVVRLKDLGVKGALFEAPSGKARNAFRDSRFGNLAKACKNFGIPLIELPEGVRYGQVSRALARLAVAGEGKGLFESPQAALDRVFEEIHREEGARLAAVCFPAGIRALRDWSDIRAAVESYLRNRGNAVAAGAELGVHRHTVKSRIQRYEALSGLSLDDPDYRPLIELAFLIMSRRFE